MGHEPQSKADHQFYISFFGSSNHRLTVFDCGGNRLFNEDVLASLSGFDGDIFVQMIGGCHDDRFEVGVG